MKGQNRYEQEIKVIDSEDLKYRIKEMKEYEQRELEKLDKEEENQSVDQDELNLIEKYAADHEKYARD